MFGGFGRSRLTPVQRNHNEAPDTSLSMFPEKRMNAGFAFSCLLRGVRGDRAVRHKGAARFPLDEYSGFSASEPFDTTNTVGFEQSLALARRIQWFQRAWFRARGCIRLDKYKGFGAYDF